MRPIEVRKDCPALKSQRNVIAMSERSVQSSENAGVSRPMTKHQGRGLCAPGSGSRPAGSPGGHGCCYDRSGGGPESGIPWGSNQSERGGQAVSVEDPRGPILRDEGGIPASSRGGGGNPCPSRVAPPRAGGLALGLKKKKMPKEGSFRAWIAWEKAAVLTSPSSVSSPYLAAPGLVPLARRSPGSQTPSSPGD